jgi:penicillin-binding protein 1A
MRKDKTKKEGRKASAKQKAQIKKQVKKYHKKTTSKKSDQKPLGIRVFRFLFKWTLVLGLWAFIGLCGLFAYYGSEISDIIESPHFERKNAMIFKDRNDKIIARYGEIKGHTVNIQDLPSHLIYAIIATEDRRFYEHPGIDIQGITRAMVTNIVKGRLSQGGSTITQQLAKNLFLSHERTIKRKVQEIILSVWLENRLTKDEILSAYLNRVYFGSGAYGVDAASRIYFNKDVKDISVSEAALIAGLLKAPSRYSPLANPEKAKKRTQVVLKLMKTQGFPASDEMPQVIKHEIDNAGHYKDNVRYFTDWVKQNVPAHIGIEEGSSIRTITTTLDLPLQKYADQVMQKVLDAGQERNVTQGAFIIMAHNGEILAMGGGRNYNASQFNRATQAYRPPGSAFKPIVFLTAYMNGYNPSDEIEDSPIKDKEYTPSNFEGKEYGTLTLNDALTLSVNTATVRLAQDVGLKDVIKTAHKIGIKTDLNHDLSLALGSSGVPLLEMASAYGVFANKGKSFTPYSYTVEDQSRENPKRIVGASPMRKLHSSLLDVVKDGTGRRAADEAFKAAGKTGTSQDYRDAWFIGYTDKFIGAVWIGNDDNSPMDNITGGSLPASIWKDIMREAHAKSETLGLDDTDYSDRGFQRLLGRFKLND